MVRSSRKDVGRWAAVITAIGLASVFSADFFQGDEHFQVLEFAYAKDHPELQASLPWEFSAAMRPWFQPAVYGGLRRSLSFFGWSDPFLWVGCCRLLSGLLWLVALRSIARVARRTAPSVAAAEATLNLAFLSFFVPYLAVRTSSESWSAAFVAMGASRLLWVADAAKGASSESGPPRSSWGGEGFWAGVALGLAFEARYQSALFLVGALAWVVLELPSGVRGKVGGAVLFGTSLSMLGAAFVDHWGYGYWVFPPWNYFRANLLEGAAASFGSSPPYAYLYLMHAHALAPLSLLLMGALGLGWVRYPRHLATYMTVPFVAVHCVLAHKEERFLFPMALLAAFPMGFAIAPPFPAGSRVLPSLWQRRSSRLAKVLYALNAVGFLGFCFFVTGFFIGAQRHIYYGVPRGVPVWTLGNPYDFHGLSMNVYRRSDVSIVAVANEDGLFRALEEHRGEAFVVVEQAHGTQDAHDLEGKLLAHGRRGRPVYRSFPRWLSPWVARWGGRTRTFTIYRVSPANS